MRTFDLELFSDSIPGTWEALHRVLARYPGHLLQAVYEAGYFGFRLHDRLVAHNIPCIVTPPSLVPQEQDNRVKTDRRDSRKLAHLLAKGMLELLLELQDLSRFRRAEPLAAYVGLTPSHTKLRPLRNKGC
jgi:transposase